MIRATEEIAARCWLCVCAAKQRTSGWFVHGGLVLLVAAKKTSTKQAAATRRASLRVLLLTLRLVRLPVAEEAPSVISSSLRLSLLLILIVVVATEKTTALCWLRGLSRGAAEEANPLRRLRGLCAAKETTTASNLILSLVLILLRCAMWC